MPRSRPAPPEATLRILYSHRIQSRDGQSVHLEAMVAALRAEGHEVLVVGPSLYQQAAFGGESRLVVMIRAHLPASIGTLAEIAYNVPAVLASVAGSASLSAGPDL